MRVVSIDSRRCGLESVHVSEREPGPLGPNQIRIRMAAAGLANADYMACHGGYPPAPRRAYTPGYDVAGTIEACGRDVVDRSVGERVAAINPRFGCLAECVDVEARYVLPLPAHVPFESAAALGLNYLTAHALLFRKARLTSGQSVAFHGAGGGVGTALLDLAAQHGIHAVGIGSTRRQALISRFGGMAVDRECESVPSALRTYFPDGLDGGLDAIGGKPLSDVRAGIKRGGVLVSYGFSGTGRGGSRELLSGLARLGIYSLLPDGRRVKFLNAPSEMQRVPTWYRETMQELLSALAAGRLSPRIGATLPLTQASDAFALFESRQVDGKILLTHIS